MSLHGTIRINGTLLYEWSARRLTPNIRAVNPYEVKLWAASGGGPFWDTPPVAETQVDHAYEDGAIGLANKVLAWARDWTKTRGEKA